MGRMSFERAMEMRRARRAAEAAGKVADSHSVRLAIVERMQRGHSQALPAGRNAAQDCALIVSAIKSLTEC